MQGRDRRRGGFCRRDYGRVQRGGDDLHGLILSVIMPNQWSEAGIRFPFDGD